MQIDNINLPSMEEILNKPPVSFDGFQHLPPIEGVEKPPTKFEKIAQLVLQDPSSLELTEGDFAERCDCRSSDVSKVFKNVICGPDKGNQGAVYPARFFTSCNSEIRDNQDKNNYISTIIVHNTLQVKQDIKEMIQSKFQGITPSDYDSDCDMGAQMLVSMGTEFESEEISDPYDYILRLFEDDATFTMTQKDLTKRVSEMVGTNFRVTTFSKYLRDVFQEKGTLWPRGKIVCWTNKIEELYEKNDPYLVEKSHYYYTMILEVEEKIRSRCWEYNRVLEGRHLTA